MGSDWSERGGKPRRKRTHVGVPLEMLVDKPKGSDRGYDGKETGYNPTHIMRYEGLRPISSVREHNMATTNLEIRHCRVEREKVPLQVPLA